MRRLPSPSVKLNIWDGEKEDGDKITVIIDGKEVLQQFELSNQIKSFVVPIHKSGTTIKI